MLFGPDGWTSLPSRTKPAQPTTTMWKQRCHPKEERLLEGCRTASLAFKRSRWWFYNFTYWATMLRTLSFQDPSWSIVKPWLLGIHTIFNYLAYSPNTSRIWWRPPRSKNQVPLLSGPLVHQARGQTRPQVRSVSHSSIAWRVGHGHGPRFTMFYSVFTFSNLFTVALGTWTTVLCTTNQYPEALYMMRNHSLRIQIRNLQQSNEPPYWFGSTFLLQY